MRAERHTRDPQEEAAAAALDPEVRAWFLATFPGFTPAQRHAVEALAQGRHVLVSSPTGTGKTLAAFLVALSDLVARERAGTLEEGVHVLYVSPLKALNNDIERNLQAPLAGIRERAVAAGRTPPGVRVAVRTGDTPPAQRQAMTRKPPHILITTPESLALLLNAPKFSAHLRTLRHVIVDEVHALADNKRGAHLALSLERLEALCASPPVRVGLSATVAPLPLVARFLAGDRPCHIVEAAVEKRLDLQVMCPVPDLASASGAEVRNAVLALVARAVEANRTTLAFTNTRAATERLAHALKHRFGPESVGAHHGSMSRERRHEVEAALKEGRLRCVVTSTSLELGLDIGHVDLVVQVGSPKRVSALLQRVGRAAHQVDGTSRGILIALDRDDLLECVALARLARERRVEPVRIPRAPLDVLCQHLVGMSLTGAWTREEALALARRAGPYADLEAADLDACLRYLAGDADGPGRIALAADGATFGRRGRMMRPLYALNAGTIPDQSAALVLHGADLVGTVEEGFLEHLQPGDVFILGGTPWRFESARGPRAQVSPAPAHRPTVPSWVSETLPLEPEAAAALQELRDSLHTQERPNPLQRFLSDVYYADDVTAFTLLNYASEQGASGPYPDHETLLIEQVHGEDDRQHLLVHAVAGRRANDALARALARSLQERGASAVGTQAADAGFVLTLPPGTRITERTLQDLLLIDLRRSLHASLTGTELLKRRFRHVAGRAFLILRRYPGKAAPVARQQVNSDFLLQAIARQHPGHPVLREAYREVLEEALDVEGAEALLHRLLTRQMRLVLMPESDTPTPFGLALLARGMQDALAAEDRDAAVRAAHARIRERLAAAARAPPRQEAHSPA